MFATDGKMTTAWGAVATEAETKEENDQKLKQWMDIDLGASAEVSSLEINWQGAWVYATSYAILVSDDEENWTKVYENRQGDGGHPISASTEVVDWDILRESKGAFDGDDATCWKSRENNDEWVQVDLEKVYKIGRMTIEWVAEFGRIFDIQTSLDGKNWTTVYRQLHGIGEKEEIHMYQNARYVRMKGYVMGRGSGYTVKELQIFEWQKGDPTVNPAVSRMI